MREQVNAAPVIGDAMKSAIEVFGEWAQNGRDERMAQGHKLAVEHMLHVSKPWRNENYSAIDAGCGNGWLVRLLVDEDNCRSSLPGEVENLSN